MPEDAPTPFQSNAGASQSHPFGNGDAKSAAAGNLFNFSASSTGAFGSSSNNGFGSFGSANGFNNNNNPSTIPAANGHNSNHDNNSIGANTLTSLPTASSTPVFSFSSTVPEKPAFTFGASTTATTAASPFGTSNPVQQAAKETPKFVFGSTAAATSQPSTLFGAASSQSSLPAESTASIFGSHQSPAFAAATKPPSSPFTFTASQPASPSIESAPKSPFLSNVSRSASPTPAGNLFRSLTPDTRASPVLDLGSPAAAEMPNNSMFGNQDAQRSSQPSPSNSAPSIFASLPKQPAVNFLASQQSTPEPAQNTPAEKSIFSGASNGFAGFGASSQSIFGSQKATEKEQTVNETPKTNAFANSFGGQSAQSSSSNPFSKSLGGQASQQSQNNIFKPAQEQQPAPSLNIFGKPTGDAPNQTPASNVFTSSFGSQSKESDASTTQPTSIFAPAPKAPFDQTVTRIESTTPQKPLFGSPVKAQQPVSQPQFGATFAQVWFSFTWKQLLTIAA